MPVDGVLVIKCVSGRIVPVDGMLVIECVNGRRLQWMGC